MSETFTCFDSSISIGFDAIANSLFRRIFQQRPALNADIDQAYTVEVAYSNRFELLGQI